VVSKVSEEVHLFFTTLMFFTRIPAPAWVDHSEVQLSRAARYFPLVGLVVGSIGAAVFWLAHLVWPLPIAVLLSMVATVVVTGAFHEDGLADSCDAFGGGWTKEQVLVIMKDSRIGTFGAVGLILALGLKFTTLLNVRVDLLPLIIVAGHSVSRFAAITFLYTQAYVRHDDGSKSKPVAQQMSPLELTIAGVTGIAPLFLLGPYFILLLIPVFGLRWLLGHYFLKRLGGYTGDSLGAVQQTTEILFYLFAAI
jgi:adenosylcobinamide-GDP ribazoletransferase